METKILTLNGLIISIGGGILSVLIENSIGNYVIYNSNTDIITLNDNDNLIWE